MNNMKIAVSKDDFTQKPPEERDWMLFQGLMNLDHHGCYWARNRWKRILVYVTSTGVIGTGLTFIAKKLGCF